MSLSEKSDEEISKLLTEYGIAHGPIVGERDSVDPTLTAVTAVCMEAMEDQHCQGKKKSGSHYNEIVSHKY